MCCRRIVVKPYCLHATRSNMTFSYVFTRRIFASHGKISAILFRQCFLFVNVGECRLIFFLIDGGEQWPLTVVTGENIVRLCAPARFTTTIWRGWRARRRTSGHEKRRTWQPTTGKNDGVEWTLKGRYFYNMK